MLNVPLVSICIPTFNGELFILEALESVRKQTYTNLEIIISDDASTDKTLDIINQFQCETKLSIAIFQHFPTGIGANWNNCIKKAKGEYIKFVFQDDVLAPTCVEKMVGEALKNKNIGMVYSKRDFIFDNTDVKVLNWIDQYADLHTNWSQNVILDGEIVQGRRLLRDPQLFNFPQNKIGEPTAVLLNKRVFEKIGFFSTTLKQSLDIEFWYRLMKYYDVVFINESLISFRLHDNQATVVNENSFLNEMYLFYKSMYSNLFWQLHFDNQKLLFFKYDRSVSILKKTINLLFKIKFVKRLFS
ncbi:glycosyltransferase family 2 protein [Flavobacterium algicola]|uniref:glycosyltransferase family 2 protein n=1 Tax=Flavobacterium algicola TaxID=556529 RepID=UPI001EFD3DB1|nr:glycosyltransferase [Flavobacterium algicola]MCG9793906.1 glycosyltransferase [Flavobacterium algicola]